MGITDLIQNIIGQNNGLAPWAPPRPTGLGGFLASAGDAGTMATRPQNPDLGDTWEPGGPSGQLGRPNLPGQRPGFLGMGNRTASILGIIGDALQGAVGREGTFGPAVMRQRELQMRDQNELQHQIALARWKAENDPDKPQVQKDYEYYVSIGRSDLANELLANHADPLKGIQTTGPGGVPGMAFYNNRMLGGGASQGGGVASPKSQAEYNALPAGTPYFDSGDGKYYTKGGGAGQGGPQTFRPGY